MKLIKRIETENYTEIEIENTFFFIKYKTTYRKYGNSIFRYSKKGDFHLLGLMQRIDVDTYFKIK